MNQAYCDHFASTFDKLVGTNFQLLIPEPERKAVMANISALSVDTPTQTHEHQIASPDGAIRWHRWTNRALFDTQGKIVSYQSVGTDITESKQAEEALHKSEQQLRLLIENMIDMIIRQDPDGTIRLISSSCIKIMGFTPQEMIGRKSIEFVHTEDRDFFSTAVKESIRYCSDRYRIEHRLVRKDGDIVWVETVSGLIYDLDHNLVEIHSTVRDITERRIVYENILQLQKLETIGVLAGGIAHDFNNLLAIITTSISLVKAGVTDDLKANLEHANAAANKASGLTKQLLTFAKGNIPEISICSVADVIKESVEVTISPTSRSKCKLSIQPDLWEAEINPSQIGQVIQNLVINADQAMDQSGTFYVEAENVELGPKNAIHLAAGPYVRISVKDSGAGIPKQDQKRIFDPFFTTKKRKRVGGGLGLAVAQSVVHSHKGKITVESTPGQGANFQVFIPAIKNTCHFNPPNQATSSEPSKSLKILFMDDEEILCHLACQVLESIGHRSESASNGNEAIEKYTNAIKDGDPFDLVILDMIIPSGMGGIETLAELKKINPQVVTIISSGYSDENPTGFNGVLPKPYDMQRMQEAIEKALE